MQLLRTVIGYTSSRGHFQVFDWLLGDGATACTIRSSDYLLRGRDILTPYFENITPRVPILRNDVHVTMPPSLGGPGLLFTRPSYLPRYYRAQSQEKTKSPRCCLQPRRGDVSCNFVTHNSVNTYLSDGGYVSPFLITCLITLLSPKVLSNDFQVNFFFL